MNFPDAYAGVKKIYKGEILLVISVIALIAASTMGYFLNDSVNAMEETKDIQMTELLSTGFGILCMLLLALASLVIGIIGYIFKIIGIFRAKKDDELFSKAYFWIISSVVASVAAPVLHQLQITLGKLLDPFAQFSQLLSMLCILGGIASLAVKCDDESVQKLSVLSKKIIIIQFIIMVVFRIAEFVVSLIYSNTIFSDLFLTISDIVIELAILSGYIFTLVTLRRAIEMLE